MRMRPLLPPSRAFHLPSDVFVLGLAESMVRAHPEVLRMLLSDGAEWEAWDLVRRDYGYIVLAHAPAIEREPADGVFEKSE